MWRGRLSTFPKFENIFYFLKIFFCCQRAVLCTNWEQPSEVRKNGPLRLHGFARPRAGKCKLNLTNAHSSFKQSDLMRISRQGFDAPKLCFCDSPHSPDGASLLFSPKRALYTTPSGLNSPQTPDIVSQRQRHGPVSTPETRHFDAPV